MITTTLATLVACEPALSRLAAIALPAKTAYQIAKLARAVTGETKLFHESRDKKIRELGAPSEDGQQIMVPPDRTGEFVQYVNELATVEVKLDATPIAFADLSAVNVTAADLLVLEPLLAFEDAKPAPSPKQERRMRMAGKPA